MTLDGATPPLLVTVAIDMLALGVIVPVLPRLIVEFEGGST